MASLNFLPGPVSIAPQVKAAFSSEPISHRSNAFRRTYENTVQQLSVLGKSSYVALLMGSGTAANAVVAQELKKLPGKGLILANGEFGERLIRQGMKAGLSFDQFVQPWGQAFTFETIVPQLQGKNWVWFTHCETATGGINWCDQLMAYCCEANIHVCLDSISAVGNISVDFSRVYLASGTSGKGFGAFPGIGIIFYNHKPEPATTAHEYLDLASYHAVQEVPFTFSSNLLNALHAGLSFDDFNKKFERNAAFAKQMQQWLTKNALYTPVQKQSANFIWTLGLPSSCLVSDLGQRMEATGFQVHYKNKYLLERNWLQIATMGCCTSYELQTCLKRLEQEITII